MKKVFPTNYRVATQWLNNSLILCNIVAEIDESIYKNLRFDLYDKEKYTEISQFFLTNCSLEDVEYLEEVFNLKFSYSDKLDLYVLCVDFHGTSWDEVYCETTNKNAKRELGDPK